MNEKNKSKKSIGIILAAIMVVSVFAAFVPTASATHDSTATIDPECIKKCDTVTIDLTITNDPGSTDNIESVKVYVPLSPGGLPLFDVSALSKPVGWDAIGPVWVGPDLVFEYYTTDPAFNIPPGDSETFDFNVHTSQTADCDWYVWLVDTLDDNGGMSNPWFLMGVDNIKPDVTANPTTYIQCTQAKGCQDVTLNVTAEDVCKCCGDNCGISEIIVEDTEGITDYDVIILTLKDDWPLCYYANDTVHIKTTAATGVYNLPVTATDCAGNVNDTETVEVKIDNTPPTAVIWANETAVDLNEAIYFSGCNSTDKNSTSDDAPIASYEWFIDGISESEEHNFTYPGFDEPGIKTVQLVVKDCTGNEGLATTDIYVREECFDIELTSEWNLISLPLTPECEVIEIVLTDLILHGTVEQVKAYDACTETWYLWPSAPPGTQLLTEMTTGKGYWIKMSQADTLTVCGEFMSHDTTTPPAYDVCEGWNLIGFHSKQNLEPWYYMGGWWYSDPILYKEPLWTYSGRMWKSCASAGWADTDEMERGAGYWVYVDEAGVIIPHEEE